MESLYRLSILVNMIDRVSGPAAKISSGVAGTVSGFQQYSAKMADLARDGVVLMGTGAQIATAAIAPVKATFETQDALAALSSLGVEKLGELEQAAKDFSNTWAGTSKADFLNASYDIKSGIASLSDEGVADYTALAGMTAKATKATTAEMTSLFATGYGIYKDYYGNLSDLEFGEVFSSGIAKSVQQFKTTGSGMAQAISALGGSATSAQVPLEEQLSVLGMLQATMSGSEAGTKYTAFLQSAAKAGGELGLSFTDASGQLKAMPEILGQMKTKFGDVLTAADKLELQKAFGTVEAVKLIDLLYGKTDDLTGNITTLQDTMGHGMAITEEMANKMNAPPGQSWELFKQKLQNTTETIGNAMLPRFMELQDSVGKTADKIASWVDAHPQLTSTIMFSVAAFGIFLASLGALKLGVGAIGSTITLAKTGIDGFKRAWTGVKTVLPLVKTGLSGLKTGLLSMLSALPGVIASVWSFTAALLANPITWIVIGIIALIVALVLLWQNWDKVTSFLQNTWDSVCNGVGNAITWLRDKLDGIPTSVQFIIAAFAPFIGIPMLIITHWDTIKEFFANLPENIKQAFASLVEWFTGFFSNLGTTFYDSGRKIISTFVAGIKSMLSAPAEAIKGALAKVRSLLPFSDAKTGPLSDLTLSGHRVLETFNTGMKQTADLPAKTAEAAFAGIGDSEPDGTGYSISSGGKSSRQTIFQRIIINCKFADIDELKKLKKLLQELEDAALGGEDDPEPEPVF